MHTRWFSSWNYRGADSLRLHATRRLSRANPVDECLVARKPQTTLKRFNAFYFRSTRLVVLLSGSIPQNLSNRYIFVLMRNIPICLSTSILVTKKWQYFVLRRALSVIKFKNKTVAALFYIVTATHTLCLASILVIGCFLRHILCRSFSKLSKKLQQLS